MLAATELDNLLKASEFIRWNPDDGRHKDAVRGWNTWRTRFAVYNSEIEDISVFEGEVKIKRIARGDVFYDITKIKNITNGIMGQSIKKDAQSISDESIITRPASEVNPEIKNSTRDPYEVSDREILANALEDATKNADEKAWLEAYKKDLAELNATQAILDENRSIISSLEYRKYQKKENLTKEETERLEKARLRVKALVKRLAERQCTSQRGGCTLDQK